MPREQTLEGEFPVRLKNSLFGAKNSLFRAEQGILRRALISRREKAAPTLEQSQIGQKIQRCPAKFAVLRELARCRDSNASYPSFRGALLREPGMTLLGWSVSAAMQPK
jgi:hypothetical protein